MKHADPADPASLLGPWNLGEPTAIERLGGSNNASWRVTTPAGSFALRLYRNTGNLPHIEFEHHLLGQLAGIPLSFKVPVPLPSGNGRTFESVEIGGVSHAVSLFPLILGKHTWDWSIARRVRAVGEAVGQLDAALAGIAMPAGIRSLPTHGDPDRIHRVLPDSGAAIANFPVDETLRDAFVAFMKRAQESIGSLYGALPQQIIHSDIDGSNLLFMGDRVSGILDFEFASRDLRAMELANSVVQIGSIVESDALDLSVVRILAGGYRTGVRLTSAEIGAIPDLIRLRGAVSVIHRTARWKSGLSPIAAVESRMRRFLALERWFNNHAERFMEAIAASS